MRTVWSSLLILVGLSTSTPVNAQVAPTFFNMALAKGIMLGEPWPVDTICVNPVQGCDGFGGLRLWYSGVSWDVMNPAPGQYDWSMFDAWLSAAQANGVDIEYTFGRVPQWASSKPSDLKCANGGGPRTMRCSERPESGWKRDRSTLERFRHGDRHPFCWPHTLLGDVE